MYGLPKPVLYLPHPDGGQEELKEGMTTMALPTRRGSIPILLFFLISSVSSAAGGILGVNYGRVANNLMPPDQVVKLLKANGIGAVSIYDANFTVLRAFSGSGIKVTVTLPNEQLAAAAASPVFAFGWVSGAVAAHYPSTKIQAVAVGVEVFDRSPNLTYSLVPAMQNVYKALVRLGLADAVKVSTPVPFTALNKSYPPSQGSFRSDLRPVLQSLLDFLQRTGSYFMVNLYPYITYMKDPCIPLDYALGLPNPGIRDPNTGLTYFSLLDAQLDALSSAMAKLRSGITAEGEGLGAPSLDPHVKETGHPSGGEGNHKYRKVALEKTNTALVMCGNNASLARKRGASVENAQAYNANLVQRILSGRTGTPQHPGADLSVDIFALFNENRKPGPKTERHYGLFYPNGTTVYDVNFRTGGDAWCVANPAVESKKQQAALNWACGQGSADCRPIQPGGVCYEPNTLEAHASYAMNSYYQKQGRAAEYCYFGGVGLVVYRRPRYGNCKLPLHGV